jgi:spoIIIJ-associated protein
MYDSASEAREFVGENREEAVGKACSFFGLQEAELQLKEPQGGEVYGLGGRAVVVAIPLHAASRPRQRPDEGGGEGRGPSGGRSRGGSRGPRRERDAAPRSRASEGATEAEPVAEPEPVSKGVIQGEVGPIGEFVLGVVEKMALGEFEISENAEGEFLIYQLSGPAAQEVGSGDGRAVDALQLLANQVAMIGSEDAPRIVVDAEGNAERRTDFLTRIAERAASRARDSRRSVALDAMNARDRRAIHLALRDAEDVATMSIGTGRYRQVVVVPEGSPEFDEARQNAMAALSRDSG